MTSILDGQPRILGARFGPCKFVQYSIRYNKTLLGDDLGEFPAPLLMNTFHFAMQVVLSTAITWFWPQRFQPRITMSWRDYFMRDTVMGRLVYWIEGLSDAEHWQSKAIFT
ncbi:putative sugar phosphate/phosphate translocator [Camellia lanceoleosa]|uniref:Sugar phosphate/phosphate translocator n=1 Tax=Camellia lanceoleosa TaxID=1840588 RepID=A0ACC0IV41_9ERIC|nr:putative sugar phosphate/phosphate translocator [Camellia lanceoleosa]